MFFVKATASSYFAMTASFHSANATFSRVFFRVQQQQFILFNKRKQIKS